MMSKPCLLRFFLFVVLGFGPQLTTHAVERNDHRFETHVRPVLARACVKCHGAEKQEGGLRLDSRAALLQGGESGPAIVAGHPDQSLLISALRYEELEMPPDDPLDDKQIAQFAAWIRDGATWPDDARPLRPATNGIADQDREWWAFQPVRTPPVPQATFPSAGGNEIDRFVHQRLQQAKLQPAKIADRVTLVRRVYQTLIGLPPTPDQVDAFAQNISPDAYEQLVETLLADQRYGERWSQFWLDLVRYAESDGWNADTYRPNAWQYRDYVVRAFNHDKPYTDFVREQLAGDERENPTPEDLAATGYLRLGIYEYNQRDSRQLWDDILNEITDVTGDVFLGMGMACARCHNHKYDPILQIDYYKLRAFFEPLVFNDELLYATDQEEKNFHASNRKWVSETKSIREQMEELEAPYNVTKWETTVDKFPLDIQASYFKRVGDRNSWDQQMAYFVDRQFHEEGGGPLKTMNKDDGAAHAELIRQLKQFDGIKPEPLGGLMSATNFEGDWSATHLPGSDDAVTPGFLDVLATSEATEVSPGSRQPRTMLSDWITSPSNPLTTRVIVNRIWKQHFGRGLVRSVSDFGTLGGQPTHPELLDWLVSQFIADGWRIKRLHKRILMSATWRQAAEHELATDFQKIDPSNALLWRRDTQRLSAEQIRDAMLGASGELLSDLGGPSVTGDEPRRSLYVRRIRNSPDRFLHAFDVANGLKSVGQRNSTTTPTQALMMINGDYVLKRAGKMAARLSEIQSDQQRVRQGIRIAWCREPSDDELHQSVEFVRSRSTTESIEKLTDFCHLLLNSNEFLYVD